MNLLKRQASTNSEASTNPPLSLPFGVRRPIHHSAAERAAAVAASAAQKGREKARAYLPQPTLESAYKRDTRCRVFLNARLFGKNLGFHVPIREGPCTVQGKIFLRYVPTTPLAGAEGENFKVE